MPRLITIISLLISMLILGVTGIFYAKETKVQFDENVSTALYQCDKKDSEALLETTKKMSDILDARQNFLSFFINHNDIDAISLNLVSLNGYAKLSSFENAKLTLFQLKYLAEHLYYKELPDLKNLF